MSRIRALAWWAGSPVRLTLLLSIRLYRVSLSYAVGGSCRFHPSCSAYAEEAIGRLGVIRGVPLAVWRLVRCSPLSAGGIDHPPRPGSASPSRRAARMSDGVIHERAGNASALREAG